jgi:hypothetical protein
MAVLPGRHIATVENCIALNFLMTKKTPESFNTFLNAQNVKKI